MSVENKINQQQQVVVVVVVVILVVVVVVVGFRSFCKRRDWLIRDDFVNMIFCSLCVAGETNKR